MNVEKWKPREIRLPKIERKLISHEHPSHLNASIKFHRLKLIHALEANWIISPNAHILQCVVDDVRHMHVCTLIWCDVRYSNRIWNVWSASLAFYRMWQIYIYTVYSMMMMLQMQRFSPMNVNRRQTIRGTVKKKRIKLWSVYVSPSLISHSWATKCLQSPLSTKLWVTDASLTVQFSACVDRCFFQARTNSKCCRIWGRRTWQGGMEWMSDSMPALNLNINQTF